MERRLRIDLAYHGEPFAGFARQPDQITVQGVLEDALHRVVRHPVELICAGRTDRGVHALGQVVHVDVAPTEERAVRALEDLGVLRQRLDKAVGEHITVWRVAEVGHDFNARFSARWRAYRYRMAVPPTDPRTVTTVWHLPGPVDVEAMAEALPVVLGEHDFASFCRAAPGRTTQRRIDEVGVTRVEDEIHLTMRGKAFCHQQVRAITGSLVEVGLGRRDAAWFLAALEARDRSVTGPVAPAHGLTLEAVGYDDPEPDAPAR